MSTERDPGTARDARHRRATELFQETLELPPAERAQRLERACGDDAELRRAVEDMLTAATRPLTDEDLAPTVEATRRLEDGTLAPVIPGVTIHSIIGRGGQGVVYRGRQTYVDREVAVKVLGSGADPTFAERFHREAQILAGLQHRSIVTCYQAGVNEEGRGFIVMEFIDGPDLGCWIRDHGALALADALAVVRDVATALQYAMTLSVIHRDVKPQNVLLKPITRAVPEPFGFVAKLADLGLARATEGELPGMVTVPGCVIGTPATMALEQIDDPTSVDFRADIYGLGCVLYHALAGEAAYAGMPPAKVFRVKAQEPPPDIRRAVPELPGGVVRLVRSMMDADRAKRPQSYDEVIERLEVELEVLRAVDSGQDDPPRRRALRWGGAAVGAILLVVLGVLAARDGRSGPGRDPGSLQGDPISIRGPSVVPGDAPGDHPGDPARGEPTDLARAPDDVVPGESGEGGESLEGAAGGIGPLDPALAPDETLDLFAAWDDLEHLLDGWELEPPDAWSSFEGDLDQILMRAPAGTATRPLPAGEWSLSGEVRVARPFGWEEDSSIRGGVRVGFASGHALHLVLELGEDDVGEAGWIRVGAPEASTGEPTGAAFGPAGLPFMKNEWIPFRMDCGGDDLRLQVGLDPAWSGRRQDHGLGAPPTTLSLTAQGLVRWRNLSLRGL